MHVEFQHAFCLQFERNKAVVLRVCLLTTEKTATISLEMSSSREQDGPAEADDVQEAPGNLYFCKYYDKEKHAHRGESEFDFQINLLISFFVFITN
jgi:hypothetical protein